MLDGLNEACVSGRASASRLATVCMFGMVMGPLTRYHGRRADGRRRDRQPSGARSLSFTPDLDAWLVHADGLEAQGRTDEALRIRRLALGPGCPLPIWATDLGVVVRDALRRRAAHDWVARSGAATLESTIVGDTLRVALKQFSPWMPRRGSTDGVRFGYQGMMLDHLAPARAWLGGTCASLADALRLRLPVGYLQDESVGAIRLVVLGAGDR